MNGRRRLLQVLAALALARSGVAAGQAAAGTPRVGVLLFAEDSQVFKDAFRAGLRDYAFEEGRSVVIEWRAAGGSAERAAQIAVELVALKVDVIVASLTGGVLAASAATKSIPIVMAPAGGNILVRNWGRPEGNITGIGGTGGSLGAKWFEFFREFIPDLKRAAVVTNRSDARFGSNLRNQAQEAGRRLGLEVRTVELDGVPEIQSAFASLEKDRIVAAAIQPSLVIPASRAAEVARLGLRHRIALASQSVEFAEAGALFSYGANFRELYRHAARYVARLLKGARAGDLPVERADRTELVINAVTAKALGLRLPTGIQIRADRLIG